MGVEYLSGACWKGRQDHRSIALSIQNRKYLFLSFQDVLAVGFPFFRGRDHWDPKPTSMFIFVGWFIEGTNRYCINLLFRHYKIAENRNIMVILIRPLQRNVIQLIFRASFAGCCRPFALEVECGAQVWKNCWMAELFQLLLLLLLLWWWWWWWFCLFYDLCVFFSICSWTSECA